MKPATAKHSKKRFTVHLQSICEFQLSASNTINDKQNDAFCVVLRSILFNFAGYYDEAIASRALKNAMHRERSKKKKKKREKERTNAWHLWRTECLAECIVVIRRRFEVYAWASSMPPIRYSRRRSRMGKQTLLPSPALPVTPLSYPHPAASNRVFSSAGLKEQRESHPYSRIEFLYAFMQEGR